MSAYRINLNELSLITDSLLQETGLDHEDVDIAIPANGAVDVRLATLSANDPDDNRTMGTIDARMRNHGYKVNWYGTDLLTPPHLVIRTA